MLNVQIERVYGFSIVFLSFFIKSLTTTQRRLSNVYIIIKIEDHTVHYGFIKVI